MQKARVLFLCTGNSARSQMAEALLRKHAGSNFEAYSAGLEPKGMNPFTVRVMNEIGIDVSGQRSKSVSEYMGRMHFGYLITVCAHAENNCPRTFPGISQRFHWAFDDPAAIEGSDEARLSAFREARDQISQRIVAWLAEQGIDAE